MVEPYDQRANLSQLSSQIRTLPAALVLCLLTLVLYATTTYPAIAGGDSGELVVAARTLGVAHPPGYPLFTLLGRLFCWLPFGTEAYRVNLSSGVFDAIAVGLLCGAVGRLTRMVWAGVLAAGLFGLSRLVWTYAVTAEVFALNNLFAAGLVFLSQRYAETSDTRLIYATAFWTGLGLSNQHTLVFYALPVSAWMVWQGRGTLANWRALLSLTGLALLGTLPYLYLPLADRKIPVLGWGDLSTLRGFLRHLLRSDYGSFQLVSGSRGTETIWDRLENYARLLPQELFYVGVPLCVVGVIAAARGDVPVRVRALSRLWLGVYLLYSLTMAALSNAPASQPLSATLQNRFWQQSNLVLCVFVGLGFAKLLGGSNAGVRGNNGAWSSAIAALSIVAVLGIELIMSFPERNQRDNYHFRDYGHAILGGLPERALLLSQGDHLLGALRYAQLVEHYRNDVLVLDQGMLAATWAPRWVQANFPDVVLPNTRIYGRSGYLLKDFFDANLPAFKIFVVNGFQVWDRSFVEKYTVTQAGLSLQIVPKVNGNAPHIDLAAFQQANEAVLSAFDPEPFRGYADTSWESLIERHYAHANQTYWVQRLIYAAQQGGDKGSLGPAIAGLERVAARYPTVEPSLFKSLGRGYELLAKDNSNAVAGVERSWKRYFALNPLDPEIGEMRESMSRLRREAALNGKLP